MVERILLGVFRLELAELLAGDGRGFERADLAEAIYPDHVRID